MPTSAQLPAAPRTPVGKLRSTIDAVLLSAQKRVTMEYLLFHVQQRLPAVTRASLKNTLSIMSMQGDIVREGVKGRHTYHHKDLFPTNLVPLDIAPEEDTPLADEETTALPVDLPPAPTHPPFPIAVPFVSAAPDSQLSRVLQCAITIGGVPFQLVVDARLGESVDHRTVVAVLDRLALGIGTLLNSLVYFHQGLEAAQSDRDAALQLADEASREREKLKQLVAQVGLLIQPAASNSNGVAEAFVSAADVTT